MFQEIGNIQYYLKESFNNSDRLLKEMGFANLEFIKQPFKKTTMETTDLVNDSLYLKTLVNALQDENQKLRIAANTDWLTCVKFYVMADRLIRDLIDEYKLYPSPIKLNSLKDRLVQFDSEIYHSGTAINKLRLNLIDTIKEAILECENYVKP